MMYIIKVKDDSTKESIIVVCPSAISVKSGYIHSFYKQCARMLQ